MLHPCTVHVALTLNVSLLSKLCSGRRLTGQGKEAVLETADNTRMSKVIWFKQDNFMIQVQCIQSASRLPAQKCHSWNIVASNETYASRRFQRASMSFCEGNAVLRSSTSTNQCRIDGKADAWRKALQMDGISTKNT